MKENTVEIVIIMDRSGSMDTVRDDAIGGFNTFLEAQKALPGEAFLTVVQFDNLYEVPVPRTDIKKVRPLTRETFQPRGSTALLDAVGKTINDLGVQLAELPEAQRPSKVIVAILTDGEENASSYYGKERIKEMIEHQTKKYNWEFFFLSAGPDAFAEAHSMGVAARNTTSYVATQGGTRTVYAQSLNASVTSSRTGVNRDDDNTSASTAWTRVKQ